MKNVIINAEPETVNLSDIDENTPIFAKKNDKLSGMIVHEKEGWILRIGGTIGCDGYHDTLLECLKSVSHFGYEFFVED